MSFAQLLGAATSTALDAGKCFGDVFPPAKILDAIGCAFSAYNILNDCAPNLDDFIIRVVTSRDPNDKVGATGSGTEHFIKGALPLPYMILFENTPDATAPAHDVVITDQPGDFSATSAPPRTKGAALFATRSLGEVPPTRRANGAPSRYPATGGRSSFAHDGGHRAVLIESVERGRQACGVGLRHEAFLAVATNSSAPPASVVTTSAFE